MALGSTVALITHSALYNADGNVWLEMLLAEKYQGIGTLLFSPMLSCSHLRCRIRWGHSLLDYCLQSGMPPFDDNDNDVMCSKVIQGDSEDLVQLSWGMQWHP